MAVAAGTIGTALGIEVLADRLFGGLGTGAMTGCCFLSETRGCEMRRIATPVKLVLGLNVSVFTVITRKLKPLVLTSLVIIKDRQPGITQCQVTNLGRVTKIQGSLMVLQLTLSEQLSHNSSICTDPLGWRDVFKL